MEELLEREVGWRWERGRRNERRERGERERERKGNKMKFSKCFLDYIVHRDFIIFFSKFNPVSCKQLQFGRV